MSQTIEQSRFIEMIFAGKRLGETLPGFPKFNARDAKNVYIPVFKQKKE